MERSISISDVALRKGAAASTLSAISYAVAVVFIRYAYDAGVSSGTAVFLRFFIAVLILASFLALSGRWTKLAPRRVAGLFLLGALAYTTLGVTWFVALTMIPAWLVSLLVALQPFLVSLGSWLFFGEGFDRWKVLALALILIGSFVLFWRPLEGVVWAGVLLMLLNSVAHTFYVLLGQRWAQDAPPAVSTTWMVLGAAVGTFGYALCAGQVAFDFSPLGWIWVLLFSITSTVLAITLRWWSIGLIGPSRSTLIGSLEQPLSVLFAVLLLGEAMSALQAVGGLLIIAGAVSARVGGEE